MEEGGKRRKEKGKERGKKGRGKREKRGERGGKYKIRYGICKKILGAAPPKTPLLTGGRSPQTPL